MTALVIGLMVALLGQSPGDGSATATLDRSRTSLGESVRLTVEVTGEAAADSEVSRPPRGEGIRVERTGSRSFTTVREEVGPDGVANKNPVLVTQFFYRVYPLRAGPVTVAPVEVTLRSRQRAMTPPLSLLVEEATGPGWLDASVSVEGERFFHNQVVDVDVRITVPESAGPQLRLSLPWLADDVGLVRVDDDPSVAAADLRVKVIESRREEGFRYVGASDSAVGCSVYSRSFSLLLSGTGEISFEKSFLAVEDARAGVPVRYRLFDSPTFSVVDLPSDGRPASFTNAVGQFEVAFDAEPREVRVGDSITLRFSITGSAGSLDSFEYPEFPVLAGSFRIFAKRDSASPTSEGLVVKSRGFEIAPLSTAVERVPPLEFAYFDPEKNGYERITWEGAPIKVFPAEGAETHSSLTRGDVEDIETVFDGYTLSWRSLETILDVLLIIAACSAFCTWAFCLRGWLRLDRAATRRRNLARRFRERLAASRGTASGGTVSRRTATSAIVTLLLADYLSERFGLPRGAVAAGSVGEQLAARGFGESIALEAERLLGVLEEDRYRSGGDEPLEPETIDEALQLFEVLEAEDKR